MTLKIPRRSGVSRTTRRQFLQARHCCRNCVVRCSRVLARAKLERQAEHRLHWRWWARGASNLAGVASENIVALCDVSQNAVDKAAESILRPASFRTFAACTTMRVNSMPWSSAPASTRTRMATHGGTEGREACLL